jgi:hypothetical protein|tara:strand:- start:427 stop:567 length:141 start_codon:yes stop_codon:yes gene_type:complete
MEYVALAIYMVACFAIGYAVTIAVIKFVGLKLKLMQAELDKLKSGE